MANDGKDAERAFLRHWEAIGHVQRLRDKRDLMGLNGGKNIADFSKPSDFLVSSPVHPLHYAEVKSTTNPTRFPFGDIRPAQNSAALMEERKGNNSYIFYIFSYATGEWFYMSCGQYAALLANGKRSVKFEELARWVK
jgi:hypothetical protein